MKPRNIKILLIALYCFPVIGFYSCDSFEEAPLDRRNEEFIFDLNDTLGTQVYNYLNSIYLQLPNLHNRISSDYLDSGSDDAMPTDIGKYAGVNNFRNGGISARNISAIDNSWAVNYTGIRRVNIFLSHSEELLLHSKIPKKEEVIPAYCAEARLLRAFFYFELMKRWGNVPVVGDKIYYLEDKIDVPQSSFEKCSEYIFNEIDAIYDKLKDPIVNAGDVSNNLGRADKGLADALRSRLYLYLASPLYNTTNEEAKWQQAADMAADIINSGEFKLYTSGTTAFKSMFITVSGDNKEGLFYKMAAQSTTPEKNNSPVGYFNTSFQCRGYTSPSQDLIDAFPMNDGTPFDWGNPAHAANPYSGRDPRLTYTVFYNGYRWLQRDVETFDGGLDRRASQGILSTQTGYYLRKFMGNFEESSTFSNVPHSFMIFRYAEILLNYVEALNEIGPDKNNNRAEIEKYLFAVRARAGITAGADKRYGIKNNLSQAELQSLIRNERRIELAFEDHRFWDIRRWKIAETVMNKPVKGIKITKNPDTSLSYSIVNVQNSQFDAGKMYWYPIPYNELLTNTSLKQNTGWNY